jgi:hypothetical protein
MKMSNFLDEEDDFDKEAWLAKKHQAYEEKIVRFMLRKMGVEHKIAELKRRCHAVTGVYSLNFDWFMDEYATFPVWLAMKSIPYVYTIGVIDLFKRFTRTTIYKAFIDCHDCNKTGMVFNWPGLGTCILHNDQTLYEPSETAIFKEINGHVFVLQLFTAFFQTVLERWSYEK